MCDFAHLRADTWLAGQPSALPGYQKPGVLGFSESRHIACKGIGLEVETKINRARGGVHKESLMNDTPSAKEEREKRSDSLEAAVEQEIRKLRTDDSGAIVGETQEASGSEHFPKKDESSKHHLFKGTRDF